MTAVPFSIKAFSSNENFPTGTATLPFLSNLNSTRPAFTSCTAFAVSSVMTDDTAKAVQEVKAGRVEFKLDKNGNVAVPVGKFSFDEKALIENGTAVIDAVVKAWPATAQGRFLA